jgi:hypothetical protein
MAKSAGLKKATQAIEQSAMEIAMGIQRPGQSKDETKLVARGIEKGIAQYKKRLGAKERELDKRLKQLERASSAALAAGDGDGALAHGAQVVRYKQHWLPWVLLLATWLLGIAGAALWLPRA